MAAKKEDANFAKLALLGVVAFVAGRMTAEDAPKEPVGIQSFAEPIGAAASNADYSVYYSNCSEARSAGAAPLREGDAGYAPHLDRDSDGVACE